MELTLASDQPGEESNKKWGTRDLIIKLEELNKELVSIRIKITHWDKGTIHKVNSKEITNNKGTYKIEDKIHIVKVFKTTIQMLKKEEIEIVIKMKEDNSYRKIRLLKEYKKVELEDIILKEEILELAYKWITEDRITRIEVRINNIELKEVKVIKTLETTISLVNKNRNSKSSNCL